MLFIFVAGMITGSEVYWRYQKFIKSGGTVWDAWKKEK
jgi:hypothetical protein